MRTNFKGLVVWVLLLLVVLAVWVAPKAPGQGLSGGSGVSGGGNGLLKSANLSDVANSQTALGNLVQQPLNTAVGLQVTNGIIKFGGFNMGTNDSIGTPQVSIYANMFSGYTATTNVIVSSKENVIEVINGDRTQAGYISFQGADYNGVLTGASDAQIGLSGGLYNTRLLSPGNSFNNVFFLGAVNNFDMALSCTRNKSTNAGTWALWYYDNTNNMTYWGMNTGGSNPRASNYKTALSINHATGRVALTNGYIAPAVLYTNMLNVASGHIDADTTYANYGVFILTNMNNCTLRMADPVAHDGQSVQVKSLGSTTTSVNNQGGGTFGDTSVTGFASASSTFMSFVGRQVTFTAANGQWWVTSNVAN